MGRRMGWKPCWLRSARRCPISGIAQPSRWPRARTTWPAWLFCGGACCCTSSTTLPNSSSRKPRTAVCGPGSKRPIAFLTQAFPRRRAPASPLRGSPSRSISTRRFSRIFNSCAPRSETKRRHRLFLNIKKENGDGSCALDRRRAPAAATTHRQRALYLDLRSPLHLVDGGRVSRFLAPSQPQRGGDELLHAVSRRPLLGDELLPDGYGVSLLGTVLFAIGGVLDLVWHRRFGVEFSVAALFSPPHLFLMFTGGLIVSGPLRAAMRRGGNRATWPAIISGALTLSMLTFFLQFDQPLIDRWAAGTMPDARGPLWMEEELGMIGLILYAAMVAGLLVLLLRRFELPIGTVTVILTINALLVSPVANHTELVLVAIVGGVAGDLFFYVLRPSPARPYAFHAFLFLTPAALTASYFIVLASTTGIWWEPNIWSGAVPVTGTVGWLVSFIALPGPAARARFATASPAG